MATPTQKIAASDQASGTKSGRSERLFQSVGSFWGLALVMLAVTYVQLPFVIRKVGEQGYGTWTLIVSATGYLSLLLVGIPMASIEQFARHVAAGDTRKVNSAIGSCIALYLGIGVTSAVIGSALLVFFERFYKVPAALSAEARTAFALVVLNISVGFVAQIPFSVMAAHRDFVRRNTVLMASWLLRLTLTLMLLPWRPSLVTLATIQLLSMLFECSAGSFMVRRRYPAIRLSLRSFDWAMVREIFSFSIFVLVLNVGYRLTFETDSLVIGKFLDVRQIGFYAVGNNFVVHALEFVVAIAAVIMPTATRLKVQNRREELAGIFLKWSKIAFSLAIAVGLFLMVLGPRLIGWWVGSSFQGPAGDVLRILIASCFVFLPVRGVALPLLMGLGKPRGPTFTFLGAGLLNLILSVLLARPLGLAGVALGTAIPNVLFSLVTLVLACRELEIPLFDYVQHVAPRASLGALPLLMLLLWFDFGFRVHDLMGLIGAGLAMAFLFGLIWVFFVYRNDPHLDLHGSVTRLIQAWGKA